LLSTGCLHGIMDNQTRLWLRIENASIGYINFAENKCSAVALMGDRLATTDMGACAIFREEGAGELGPHLTQCGLGQGLPMYKVAS